MQNLKFKALTYGTNFYQTIKVHALIRHQRIIFALVRWRKFALGLMAFGVLHIP